MKDNRDCTCPDIVIYLVVDGPAPQDEKGDSIRTRSSTRYSDGWDNVFGANKQAQSNTLN